MREIYLDHAATTQPLQKVAAVVADTMMRVYGNPSSLHKKGMEAETIIKTSSMYLAKMMGCQEDEIIYTSGGSESNNTALIGSAYTYKRRGRKIITSEIEHPSVAEPLKYLESQGFQIERLPCDQAGYVNREALKEALDDQTILVSIMHVNNEIGTIQPIEEIGALIKAYNQGIIFHVDAVQSFGKLPLWVKKNNIDLLSASAHKFYGPKGIGFLYKNKKIRLSPLIYGGGQQKGNRSGTENTAGIAGMLEACKYVLENREVIQKQQKEAKQYLAHKILAEIPHTWVNGPDLEEGAPHILNMRFKDIRAEVLLHALEQKGIYVSSGSACASNKKANSQTLTAIGHQKEDLDNALRFSFGLEITQEDLNFTAEVLKEQTALLRRYTLGGKSF